MYLISNVMLSLKEIDIYSISNVIFYLVRKREEVRNDAISRNVVMTLKKKS